jgi:hypothetical protein
MQTHHFESDLESKEIVRKVTADNADFSDEAGTHLSAVLLSPSAKSE